MWNKSTVLLLCSNFRPSGFLLIFSSPHAKFSELKAGNYKQMVQTRLLWFWEARTHRRLYAPPWSKGDSSLSLDDFGFVYWFRKLVFRWFWFCLSLIRQSISHTNIFGRPYRTEFLTIMAETDMSMVRYALSSSSSSSLYLMGFQIFV